MEENMVQKTDAVVQALTSMEVAEMIGKEHKNLIRDIRRYTSQFNQLKIEPTDFFIESTYQSEQGKTLPCYQVTKKGCEFIAHKRTGVKGTAFTAKYINRFHEMETELAAPGLAGEKAEKLLTAIQMQNDLIQKQIGLIGSMNERIAKLEQGRETISDNLFGSGSDLYADRCRTIDQMVTRIAELRRMDKMRVLHLLYREIDTRNNISLDAYKSVLQSETGRRYNMLETIARHEWIYNAAVELCRDSIERHEVFAPEVPDEQ